MPTRIFQLPCRPPLAGSLPSLSSLAARNPARCSFPDAVTMPGRMLSSTPGSPSFVPQGLAWTAVADALDAEERREDRFRVVVE